MIEYIDQGVEDMRLHLVVGDYTLEQFTVLRSRNVMWKEARVDFAVLGESHIVSLKIGDFLFSEICACSPALFPKATSVLLSEQVTEIDKTPKIFKIGPIEYMFSYECINYKDGKNKLRKLRELNKSTGHALSYSFPKHTFFSENAVTEVYLRESLGGLHAQTVHTYPNLKQMVFTESFISFL
jgi:hypothetical protein